MTSERRERQKVATREGILNAALEIARSDGWTAVTIRRVAEIVEYTAPIVYEYFAGKDALLEELQHRGFALLDKFVRDIASQETDSRQRLLRLGDAYIRFAYEQPEYYEIMHGPASKAVSVEKTFAMATPGADVVENCLKQWSIEHNVKIKDIATSVDVSWALLHGLVTLEKMGRIDGGEKRVRELGWVAMDDLLTAWSRPE